MSGSIPSSRCSISYSALAALESPSVTLRPTEEEEQAKAENAKGVEMVAVQSKLQNGQDGAASQKVRYFVEMNLLAIRRMACALYMSLEQDGLPSGLGQSGNQQATVQLMSF